MLGIRITLSGPVSWGYCITAMEAATAQYLLECCCCYILTAMELLIHLALAFSVVDKGGSREAYLLLYYTFI